MNKVTVSMLYFILGLFLFQCDTKMQTEHVTRIEPKTVQLTNDGSEKSHPAWSPDGSMIAFAGKGNIGFLYQYSLDGKKLGWLSVIWGGLFDFDRTALSPDGTRLVCRSRIKNHLWVLSLTDRSEILLTPQHAHAYNPVWSPMGTKIAYTTGDEIWIVSADGENSRKVLEIQEAKLEDNNFRERYFYNLSWSPDEDELAYDYCYWFEIQQDSIWILIGNIGIVALESGETRPLTTDSIFFKCNPFWSPDGNKILFVSAQSWDDSVTISMVPASGGYAHDLGINPKGSFDLVWSPDGSKIASPHYRDKGIYIISLNGSAQRFIPLESFCNYPLWHPDGDKIIVPENVSRRNICAVFLEDSRILPLTLGQANLVDNYPVWISGSSQLLFVRDNALWTVSALGQEAKLLDSDNSGGFRNLAISPDGTRIAYDDYHNIYIIPSKGGDAINLGNQVQGSISHPTWSPDGKRLACNSQYGIKILSLDGDKVKEDVTITGYFLNPSWSVENPVFGSHIVCEGDDGIYMISPDKLEPELIHYEGQDPCWSPDGTKIAYVKDNEIYITTVFQELGKGYQ